MKLRIISTAKQVLNKELKKVHPELSDEVQKQGFDKIRWEGNIEEANYFIVGRNGYLGITDVNGEECLHPIVDKIGLLNHPLVVYKQNDLWGILNPERDYSVAVYPNYDYAVQKTMMVGKDSNAKEVHVLAIRESQVYGIGLDLEEILIPNEENLIKEIKSLDNNTYGGLLDNDTTTTKKDKPEKWKKSYDSVEEFKTDYAVVKKGDKYGLVDRNGKVIVKVLYEVAYAMGDNQFKFRNLLTGEILMWKPRQ